MLPILFLLLSLLSLACSQPTFLRVGPSLVNPPTSWPAPREKANAEWISLTTNFYDGNAENPITLSNYGVIYGGQNNLGQLMNDGQQQTTLHTHSNAARPPSPDPVPDLALVLCVLLCVLWWLSVWASVDGMTWVWVAGYVGTSPHGRVPLSFPTRSDVAHCQDGAFVQYRAGGALSTTMFNDGQLTPHTHTHTHPTHQCNSHPHPFSHSPPACPPPASLAHRRHPEQDLGARIRHRPLGPPLPRLHVLRPLHRLRLHRRRHPRPVRHSAFCQRRVAVHRPRRYLDAALRRLPLWPRPARCGHPHRRLRAAAGVDDRGEHGDGCELRGCVGVVGCGLDVGGVDGSGGVRCTR